MTHPGGKAIGDLCHECDAPVMSPSQLVSQDAGQATAPIAAWRRYHVPFARVRRSPELAILSRRRPAPRRISAAASRRPAAVAAPRALAVVREQVAAVPEPVPAAAAVGSAASAAGTAASAAARRVGERYRLDDLIRQVRGAQVWRGTDEVLNRAVTVWVLRPGQPVPAQVRTAVLGAARMSDARIARIFDADCAVDQPYVVSEWPSGQYLDDLVMTGLPDPWTAATMIMVAAAALATAHDAGRPHLCLSPHSMLWSRNGLKITGLGLEAALSGTLAADPAAADTRGLAALLYALLTGYWPGDGETRLPRAPTAGGTLCGPRRARADVPEVLDAITSRALLPGMARRIMTPAELAWELREARRHLPLSARELGALALC